MTLKQFLPLLGIGTCFYFSGFLAGDALPIWCVIPSFILFAAGNFMLLNAMDRSEK